MMRRLLPGVQKARSWFDRLTTNGELGVALLAAVVLSGCAADRSALSLREEEVAALTQEILTSHEGEKSLHMRDQALREYERFVLSALEIPESRSEAMADAAHRLADLYMDVEPVRDHSRSRALYEKVLTLYPKRSRNDAVFYQLSRGAAEEGKREKSQGLLERLVREYPDGGFAQEAFFRLGEQYYDEDRLTAAAQSYRMVLRKQDLFFYEKGLYKLGWTLFQLKDYPGAADSFMTYMDRKGFKVSRGGQVGEINLPASEMDTLLEVVNVTVLVFDYMGGAEAVEEYFRTRGDQRYETYVYRRLGDLYMQMGRFKEAADIYEAFIHSNPLHEDDPYFQAQVIEAYTRGNFVDLAHEARIILVETYREGGGWFQANAGESKRKARALVQQHREQVRESMHELALYHHARAQGSKKRDDWSLAVSWERRFMETFPDDSRIPQVRFLMAEGLFENGDYKEAGEAYHRIAYPDPSDLPCDAACRALRGEAGYAELLSFERRVKTDGKIRGDDPLARSWITAGERFLDQFPEDPRIPGILLNEGEVRYQLQEFEPAREALQKVLTHPKTDDKTRYLAQRLLADSFLEEEAYLRTEEEIRKAIALIPKGREKDRPLLEKALASSIYKQGEGLRDQGDLAGAAKVFLRVATDLPTSAVAPTALFEAAGLYIKLGEKPNAKEVYQNLIRNYPDSPLAENALLSWADMLAEGGRYTEAAGAYERAAQKTGRDPRTAAEAAFMAGLMYEKAADWEGVQRAFSRYRATYPDGKRKVEAVFKTAGAKEKSGDIEGALRLYQEVVALQKETRDAAPEGIALAARSQFRLTEEKKTRFDAVRLVSPLEKNLAKKKGLLKEVLEGYTAAAKYRIDEITTASAFRMGETLEQFRDALLASERPSDLTPEQLEQYEFLLEEQAYPFEEKAIAAYESNPRRTQETGIYDSWIRESYSRLATLLPVRYQRIEQGERFSGEIDGETLRAVEIPSVLNSAGIWFREQGAFDKAEDAYQRALRLDPRYPEAQFNLGILNELYRNRPEIALGYYRTWLHEMNRRISASSPESLSDGSPSAAAGGEKGELIQKVELWIAALEKKVGGTP